MNKTLLKKYAKLVVKVGVNLGSGDELYLAFNENGIELAREIASEAYKLGAKHVELLYSDDKVKKMAYEHEDKDTLCTFPKWFVDRANYIADNKTCYISILSDDPEIFEGIDSSVLADVSKARHTAMKSYYDAATTNKIRWSLCAVPNKEWATKMFPDMPVKMAVDKLWEMIFVTMRLNEKDPVKAWEQHIKNLEVRSKILTESKFDKFVITNELGTNLTVKMPDNYYFSGGHELSQDGVGFTANMPTEEVFSLPYKYGVDGIVYSAMPLVHNGKVIDKFFIKFKDGRITDYGAEKGYDTLKGIIETDEGSHYLGEIAFVQYDSPIRSLNTLFYETLFDENASCHLAIGEAYPMITGKENATEQERDELGINYAGIHVDFMIGTKDHNVVGIKKDGTKVQIMQNGNFTI